MTGLSLHIHVCQKLRLVTTLYLGLLSSSLTKLESPSFYIFVLLLIFKKNKDDAGEHLNKTIAQYFFPTRKKGSYITMLDNYS